MESNDNDTFPEVRNWKPHFHHGAPAWGSGAAKIREDTEELWEKGDPLAHDRFLESEHKKAGSKTSASGERTLSA